MISNQQELDDSFSSDNASSFNKGAAEFLLLVENALEQQQDRENTLKFSSLVMQMMDLGLDQRLPTTQHVAEILNDRGWNPQQVARVWSVPTGKATHQRWSDELLKGLGGKDILTEVWLGLKENHMTGFPKRQAMDDVLTPVKRMKMDGCYSSSSSSSLASPPPPSLVEVSKSIATKAVLCSSNVYANETLPSNSDSSPSLKQPRGRTAKRRRPALREKITWWFRKQDEPSSNPPGPSLTPERSQPKMAASPDMFLATPGASTSLPPVEREKKRKQRRRLEKKDSGGAASLAKPNLRNAAPSNPTPVKIPLSSKPNLPDTQAKKTCSVEDPAAALSASAAMLQ